MSVTNAETFVVAGPRLTHAVVTQSIADILRDCGIVATESGSTGSLLITNSSLAGANAINLKMEQLCRWAEQCAASVTYVAAT